MKKKTALVIFFVIVSAVYGENFIAYKHFKKPYKPFKFSSSFEEEQFFKEVAIYKEEVEKYVLEQDEAIGKHKSARDSAMEEWNDFAKYQLGDSSKQIHKK